MINSKTDSISQEVVEQCRVLVHEWKHGHSVVDTYTGAFGFLSVCQNCGTTRMKYITRSGQTMPSRYRYPKGYARKGPDRMSPQSWRQEFIVTVLSRESRA